MSTSHIDTEAVELNLMERYLEGSLTDKEQREMEANLAEDPILADALEGLALIEDKDEMKLALGRIQEGSRKEITRYVKKRDLLSKRRSRVEHGNFKRTNYYVAAAAAVTVLVCTIWVIDMSSNKKEASFAQAEKPSEMQYRSEAEIALAPIITDSLEESVDKPANEDLLFADAIAEEQNILKDLRQVESKQDKQEATSDELGKESSFIEPIVGNVNKDANGKDKVEVQPEISSEKAAPAPTAGAVANRKDDATGDDMIVEAPLASKQEESSPVGLSFPAKEQVEQIDTAPVLSEMELSKIPLEEKAADDVYDDYANEAKTSKKKKARPRRNYNYNKPLDLPAQSEEDIAYGKIAKGQHMADLMIEAIALYELGSNDESLVLLKEVLQTSPENPAANYYVGSIYRKYSQMKTASSYLKEAVKYPQSPLIEEARWELAKVYLARNKKGLAKKLLLLLATEGNKFAGQARAELSKLE